MRMDLLELAVPQSYHLELSTIPTAWGPSDTTICLVSGTVLGQLSSAEFGRKHPTRNAVAHFQIVQLTPMLRHLPSAFEVPSVSRLLQAVGFIVSSCSAWALWCEPDLDQVDVKELSLEARELVIVLERALRPGPKEERTFLATYGL